MRQTLYNPKKSGKKMTIACFVSGSGTNYREIVNRNPNHYYIVFTNRPGCGAELIAEENEHRIVRLSHVHYLEEAKAKYGAGKVPRNCPERMHYEMDVSGLLEEEIGGAPDLICLAGYDQWLTDWFVDRYSPRILNVHPGDTTKGYDGLHWIPTARAILAEDDVIRSTLFIVDRGEDTGPVLVQSRPLDIVKTLSQEPGLTEKLGRIIAFSRRNGIKTFADFKEKADVEEAAGMEHICKTLQEVLKVSGDWEIFPFAVDLIAKGRVEVEDRNVYVDGKLLPAYGYRLDNEPRLSAKSKKK
jgi:folate-dependent phosphoribosylglycinamide formyltransferase PurN